MYILYLIVYDFTRFMCADNCAPQDHFRCVMVCYMYLTGMPQKAMPGGVFHYNITPGLGLGP